MKLFQKTDIMLHNIMCYRASAMVGGVSFGENSASTCKNKNLFGETLFQIFIFLILGLILFGEMYSNIKPEKLDLTLFSVAEQTIRSPITVEDKQSTEKKRKEALDQVKDVYILKKNTRKIELI